MPFPTTPILDTFTRADENPLAGIWTGPMEPGGDSLQLLSNQVATIGAVNFGGSYVSALAGADCEAYATIATNDAGNRSELYVRGFTDINGLDGYCVSRVGSTWSIRRKINTGDAQIGATATQAFSSGDSMGIAVYGTTLEGWYKPAAGAWTLVLSRSDSTYAAGGFIGIRMFGTTYRVDDFGGGTIVGGSNVLVPHHGIGMGRW